MLIYLEFSKIIPWVHDCTDGDNDDRDGKDGPMRPSADDGDGNGGYQIPDACVPVSRQLSEESHYLPHFRLHITIVPGQDDNFTISQ